MGETTEAFAGHAILELLGHRRLAGYLTEQQIAGAAFIRIEIPGDTGKTVTQFYNPSSVYGITPCTAEAAFAVAKQCQPEPVSYYDVEPLVRHRVGIELARIEQRTSRTAQQDGGDDATTHTYGSHE